MAPQPTNYERCGFEIAESGTDTLDEEPCLCLPPSRQTQDQPSLEEGRKFSGDQSSARAEENITEATGNQGENLATPIQKRRRVTRACDECRRKKIKCDGKQPCPHCFNYGYECAYDGPSNRRKNPSMQYIEFLENRLQRVEALLREFIPNIDLNNPHFDLAVPHEFQALEGPRAQVTKPTREEEKQDDNEGAQIRSMTRIIGKLDMSEYGRLEFHGVSSDAVFLDQMNEYFHDLLGHQYRRGALFSPASHMPGIFNLDATRSEPSLLWDSRLADIYNLPPKEHAQHLCYLSLHCATCLLRIIHIPSFSEAVERLYEKRPEAFATEDNWSLGLLYSVMALGCLYSVSDESSLSYKLAMEEGLKYCSNARALLQDLTDCYNLVSLQGHLFMILFFQETSDLSSSYTLIGMALRAAFQMGLHRHLPHVRLTVIEHESRRRVFHVIRQMDTYISALLGFPVILQDEDTDQLLPTEVDDEYITEGMIVTPPVGTPSFFEAFNAHARLMDIMAKVIKYIYPLRAAEECVVSGAAANATYIVSYSRVQEIEGELREWYETLPMRWHLNHEGPTETLRVQTLLRFAYVHVRTMLHRPFLHYISPKLSATKVADERYYSCLTEGIAMSRAIVRTWVEAGNRALLIGPHCFILNIQLFAILSLVFYALENPDKPSSSEIFEDAVAGWHMIASLSQKSMAAEKVTASLNSLLEGLPEQSKVSKSRLLLPAKEISTPLLVQPLPVQIPQARRLGEMSRPSSGSDREHPRNNKLRRMFDLARGLGGDRPVQQYNSKSAAREPLDSLPMTSSSIDHFLSHHMSEYNSSRQRRHAHLGQHQDGMQSYMPNTHDDIEGGVLSPNPPCRTQPSRGHGVGLPVQACDSSSAFAPEYAEARQAVAPANWRQRKELEEFLTSPIVDVSLLNFGSL